MPYNTIRELPPSVRNALPQRAQQVWRQAFNEAITKDMSEERAFRYAWGAVQRAWTKDPTTGQWVRREQDALQGMREVIASLRQVVRGMR